MKWIRTHLSSAHLIAMIALFVALGSTSIAAVTLTKNSVGAKQIKKNAVTASEVKRNAVGASELRSNAVASGDIADNGVGGADLSDNSVGAGEIANNAVGSGEVANGSIAEADLVAGLLAKSLEVTIQRTDVALADNTTQAVEAACPAGTVGVRRRELGRSDRVRRHQATGLAARERRVHSGRRPGVERVARRLPQPGRRHGRGRDQGIHHLRPSYPVGERHTAERNEHEHATCRPGSRRVAAPARSARGNPGGGQEGAVGQQAGDPRVHAAGP